MSHIEARFLIETQRRTAERAAAAQHLRVVEAQQAGMKIIPLLSLSNVNIGFLAVALAHALDWLGQLFAVWSCRILSRYGSVPLGAALESQSSPCSS